MPSFYDTFSMFQLDEHSFAVSKSGPLGAHRANQRSHRKIENDSTYQLDRCAWSIVAETPLAADHQDTENFNRDKVLPQNGSP